MRLRPADPANALAVAGLSRLAKAPRRARAAAVRIAQVRPAYVLGAMVVAGWAMTAMVALSAAHNGWLFYSGGDATYYWTAAEGLTHRWVVAPVISYALPVLLWPLALVVGPSLLGGLSTVVLLQVGLLGPLLLVALYGIGSYFGGRLLGYVAAGGWVFAPLLALGWFERGFRSDIHDLVVPNTLGLTLLGDFASLVCAAVVVALLVRSFDRPGWNDVLLGAVVTGFMIGIKPANAVFLPAPLLGLAVARRWRQLPAFLAALLPALVTLTLWKRIGVGHIPAFSLGELRTAAGPAFAPPPIAALEQYFPFEWTTFRDNLRALREVGWSVLLVEWVTIAGSLALIRRAPAAGVLVSTWFFSYVLLKGGAEGVSDVMQTNFFRLIQPSYPALVLLAAGLTLLVPTWGRRRRSPAPVARRPERPSRGLVVAFVALAAYPLVVVAIATAAPRDRFVNDEIHNQSVPVEPSLGLRVVRGESAAHLDWEPLESGATRVAYRIYRARGAGCDHHDEGAQNCILRMAQIATTRGTQHVDRTAGRWTYRVAVVADERRDRVGGDLVVISPAAAG